MCQYSIINKYGSEKERIVRRFFSYGPLDRDLHYYAPRKELIEQAYTRLKGESPEDSGYYITVWAPRQCGKTWVMQQILWRLQKEPEFDVLKINLEHLKYEDDLGVILSTISREIGEGVNKELTGIDSQSKFQEIFRKGVLEKPLILIMDEFDALSKDAIHAMVSAFRNIHIKRRDDSAKTTGEKSYLLHGVALIGVRSVLGIENKKGSPFNVQKSAHIPNLTYEETKKMFQWYQDEHNHKIEPEVIDELFYETRGQPGLTCWLGELMTEGFEDYKVDKTRPFNMKDFRFVYTAATVALPSNNIMNLISHAKKEKNKLFLVNMFQTGDKLKFTFDEPTINDLYMNGLVDKELEDDGKYYLRFACPLVQKRLFNFFSYNYFQEMGQLLDPFTDLDDIITDTDLNIPNILGLYQIYIDKNKEWLFKSSPRRTDMRLYEAVYHFNLYAYLENFLQRSKGRVHPEFPTGNGKIDLVVAYKNNRYGLELKSYTDHRGYKTALEQAAAYGKQLKLQEIFVVFFVEAIDEENKKKLETRVKDKNTGVTVIPLIIATGV